MNEATRTRARESVLELALRKTGQLTCRHRNEQIVKFRGRMFVRCNDCGRETQGFTVRIDRREAKG